MAIKVMLTLPGEAERNKNNNGINYIHVYFDS